MPKTSRILQQVLVSDYAAEGRSLARIEGKVVFIEGAVPGDLVDVLVGKDKKDWAEGKAVKFHRYSEDRVQPFCSHFGTCGGCRWQMLPYELQLQHKAQQVKDSLERIAKIPLPEISPILGAERTTHYRNKMEYTFSNRAWLPSGEWDTAAGGFPRQDALGFHLPGIFDKVLNITECHLQPDPGNLIRNEVRDYAIARGLPFYDIRNSQGWLRNLVVRICRTGETMVNLVVKEAREELERPLMDHLMEKVPSITTLVGTVNGKANDNWTDQPYKIIYGPGYVTEQLGAYQFRIGPKSFFQTNSYQGERLYEIVREMSGLTGKENVYDLYCGTGTIGIFVSSGAARVTGLELVAEAVEDARQNAALNGVRNADFICGDVTQILREGFLSGQGKPDVVITDPPRAGMTGKLIDSLLSMEAQRIVYVSCNPATQARDLIRLGEKYTVERVQPVDMFPHTQHIENVLLLVRRD